MGMQRFVKSETVNGKFICYGSFFCQSRHRKYNEDIVHVKVPQREKKYLVYISNTMLSAPGGDFDEDDTIFTDIFKIDGRRMDASNGFGGVWDRHFLGYGNVRNMAISAFVGTVQSDIMFRIGIEGDNWVGASFFVMQL